MVVDASSNNVQNMLFSQTKVSLVGTAIFEVMTAYKHGLFESCPSPSPTTTKRNTITVHVMVPADQQSALRCFPLSWPPDCLPITSCYAMNGMGSHTDYRGI